ncbi:M23 family metallopeptidase [Halieaceae bacterium IMCC11814]|uniref:M23 family metallopeptidase n=2 Tax=Candidatus Marimicrobium litorale TaxID=2518991 RepID=A0ABT3T4J3_9GAMM|nr:M23 family metallopeptidase [Candidatus Marimicrobium litorale]
MLFCMASLAGSSVVWGQCPELEGSLTQGGLVWGVVAPGSRATLDGEDLDVMENGTLLAGFGRDAAATAELVVTGEASCRQTLAIAPRNYNIQRVEGVPQKTVTPSAQHLERIRREQVLINAARAQQLQRPDLLGAALTGFEWPSVGPISGVYGSQRYYNGSPGRPHYGVDVAMPTGSPVRAPAAGVVTLAEPDLFYSGGTVFLDHGYRLSSAFLHMSKVLVRVGQELRAGDLIGEIGASGRATGPHLDWRMNWRNRRIDPQLLAPSMPLAPVP